MAKLNKEHISISSETARRLEVTKQRLAGKLPAKPTREEILSVTRDTCYIQWDPVDAVAPSHNVAYWSRLGNFKLSDLDRLLWDEKKLFLHWTPQASIVLTEDYPIFSSLMRRFPESLSDSWGGGHRQGKFLAEHKNVRKKILDELKKKGPLEANQFEDYVRSKSPDGWTSGSVVSRMLFYLLMMGDVMIVGHNGLKNIYGLSDGFLPKWVDRKEITEEEFEHEAAQRSLRALGTGFAREIHLYFPHGRYRSLEKTLDDLERESKIHRVRVEGLGRKGEQYIHDQDLRILESLDSKWEPRMTMLAPFDNILHNRDRLRRLFGTDYVHENFLPANKRKYGTYVHPILWGEKLIGRADLRMDKENVKLNVISVHAEPGAPTDSETVAKIGEMMGDFATFLGADDVEYSGRVPAAWKSSLR